MSFNIMDMVKGQVSDQLVGQIGGLLGESPDKARSAIDSALPTLMAGMGEAAQDPTGADTLFNLVNRQDDGVVNNIGSMIGSNQSSQLIESGTRGLGSLLGNKGVTSMIGGLSSHSGLGKGSAGSLLGMLAPMVLGQLKSKSGADGLNANGLASMLKSQGTNISSSMPAGMLQSLESAGFGQSKIYTGAGANTTTTTTSTTTGSGFSGAKVAAGAAAAGATATAAAGGAARKVGSAATSAADRTAATAGSAARGTANTARSAANTAGNAAQGAASRTGSAVGNAAGGAKRAAGSVADKAGSAAGNAADATRGAAGSVGRTVSGAASGAADKAKDAAGSVGRGVDAAGNRVGDTVGRAKSAATPSTTRTASSGTTGTASTGTTGTATSTRTPAARSTTTHHETPKKSGGFWKWLIIPILAILGWFGLQKMNATDDADVSGTTESATAAAGGVVDVDAIGGQMGDFFSSTTEKLNGITDADSATAALPDLTSASESLQGISGMMSGADDTAKSAISDVVKDGMGSMGPVVDKLKGDSGIWDVLSPVMGPMMDTLGGLGG